MIYRTKKITVRLTDKEYAKLREMSETSGLKMEPVIRKLLVGYEIRPRPNATYIKLIKELSAVGNNLNQIAHLANATRENYRGPVERNASASGKDMGFLCV